jgi:hypothetical protein
MIPPTPESDSSDSPQSPSASENVNHEIIPPKRKAGRKPLYKTAQERRDRNRRAQLAFRARRSDYLTKLEETCRSLENVVIELQESNRTTNDALARERAKVRLLERMLQSQSTRLSSQGFLGSTIGIPIDPASSGQPVATHSLIALEQFGISDSNMNILFPENPLGMLPLPLNDL